MTLYQACRVQLEIQAAATSGEEIMTFRQDEIDRHLQDMAKSDWYAYECELEWNACPRCMDREAPEYKT